MTGRSWRPSLGLLRGRGRVHCRPPLPVAREHAPGDAEPTGGVDLPSYLARLHDSYVERVNQAVAEGRDDLVQGLMDAYTDEALQVITGP